MGGARLDIAGDPPRRCRQLSLDKPRLNQVKKGEAEVAGQGSSRHRHAASRAGWVGTHPRASQIFEARGEEDQGLVDDHRYQARRAWVLQGGAVSVGDRGATAPGRTK